MDKKELSELATNIRYYREKKGISQAALGEKMGMKSNPQSRIYNWESGRGIPRPGNIEKLCKVLGVSEAQLRGMEQKEVSFMTKEELRNNPAYLLGRLLAILNKAEEESTGKKIPPRTLEGRYNNVTMAPVTIVRLMTATAEHINKAGEEINNLIEDVMAALPMPGGIPKKGLNLDEQGYFAFGFYRQRGELKKE
jgi:transcriptional regulator with XRE-family HTH domain